jgi:hypothetical protein
MFANGKLLFKAGACGGTVDSAKLTTRSVLSSSDNSNQRVLNVRVWGEAFDARAWAVKRKSEVSRIACDFVSSCVLQIWDVTLSFDDHRRPSL